MPEAGLLLALFGGLAATLVSIWLWVRYSLASPALMLEKQGVIAAMRRSAKLVRGAWWRVLGMQLLAYLLIAIVEFIIQIPATLVAFLIGGENLMDWASGTSNSAGWSFLIVLGVGAVISSTITFPISAGVTALLYMDQRIRREALDLELARAAGLPGYGADAPTARPAAPAPAATVPTARATRQQRPHRLPLAPRQMGRRPAATPGQHRGRRLRDGRLRDGRRRRGRHRDRRRAHGRHGCASQGHPRRRHRATPRQRRTGKLMR